MISELYETTNNTVDIVEEYFPDNIYELINQTQTEFVNQNFDNYANCLIYVIKKYKLWPSLQVKKFKNNDNLVLLHNTYKRNDVDHYKKLYDQTRSVVLDFTLSDNNNIVVSYANSTPERVRIADYVYYENDKYQEAYDGTSITVYNYNDKWHFGTASCPDVNSSRFYHPKKTHGNMLDEVLMTYFRNNFTDDELVHTPYEEISERLRSLFTCRLDKNIAYEFVLIHYENTRIVDYSAVLGSEYKVLININAKDRTTLCEIDIMDTHSHFVNTGVIYPKCFSNIEEVSNYMSQNHTSYGVIAKRLTDNGTKLYKISTDQIMTMEETNPCNPNVWYNMLIIYMKNKSEYKVCDYISQYAPNIVLPIDNYNKEIDPTYLIHTSISCIKDIIYNLYISTTKYYSKFNRFKMNKELDAQFPPIIRFHLAQLRNKQLNIYKGNLITQKEVYHYLCQCNNVENIKTLINFFITNTGYNINNRSVMCLTILDIVLSSK